MKCAECGEELHRDDEAIRLCDYCEDFGGAEMGDGYRAATETPRRLADLLVGDHETALAMGLCAMSDRIRRASELLRLRAPADAPEPRPSMLQLIREQRCENGHPCACVFDFGPNDAGVGIQLSSECCVHGERECVAPAEPDPETIVNAARAFVHAWADNGRGYVLLPKRVEGHAFDLVRAVHAAYPPASDPYNPSAPKPHGEPTDG